MRAHAHVIYTPRREKLSLSPRHRSGEPFRVSHLRLRDDPPPVATATADRAMNGHRGRRRAPFPSARAFRIIFRWLRTGYRRPDAPSRRGTFIAGANFSFKGHRRERDFVCLFFLVEAHDSCTRSRRGTISTVGYKIVLIKT